MSKLQTMESFSDMIGRILEKSIAKSNGNMQHSTKRAAPKKTVPPNKTVATRKIITYQPAPKPKASVSTKSNTAYNPSKVIALRKRRNQDVSFLGAGSSKIIKPANNDSYNPAKVRELREKRKEAKTTIKVQNSVKKPVLSSITPKMSSGYNPAKAKELRQKSNRERGKGLGTDFEKYMSK